MTKKSKIVLWIGVGVAAAALITGGIVIFNKRHRVKAKAGSFEGMKETANNSGFANKAFQKMMSEVGWRSGESWCMYFAKMVWMRVYKADADKLDRILTGSTQGTWQNAVNDNGKTVTTTKEPKVGDIVIWQNYSGGKGSWTGHAGIVTKVYSDGFNTIEGNTSEAGSREGTTVLEKERKFAWNVNDGLRLKGFIRKVK